MPTKRLPQVPQQPPPSQKNLKARNARIARGQEKIAKVLQEERLVITASKLRCFFKDKEGRTSGGSELTCSEFALMVGLPEGTIIMPSVGLEVQQGTENGQ